jgi:hypothetical protein
LGLVQNRAPAGGTEADYENMILAAAVGLIATSASAQEMGEADGAAADAGVALDWLEGCWTGEGLGGQVTECWMSVPDGTMIGAFQHVADGRLNFSEILMIGKVGGVQGYHVKHFNPDFTGWEARDEAVSLPQESVEAGRAEFNGLVYELTGEGQLRIALDMHTGDGGVRTVVFELERMD